jgi:hypothetical protein
MPNQVKAPAETSAPDAPDTQKRSEMMQNILYCTEYQQPLSKRNENRKQKTKKNKNNKNKDSIIGPAVAAS